MIIRDYCGLGYTEGEIGLEIEMEGRDLFAPRKWWKYTLDGSLRGNSLEWVLFKPLSRDEIQAALDYLVFNSKDSRLDPSDRCGVHVHINCQEMSIRQMFMFAMLYLVVEPVLMKWCGQEREGNLFCLRTQDAEGLVLLLKDSIEAGNLNLLNTDNIRYASLNFNSLFKFGSLEFRGFGTPKNLMDILKWVDLLLKVRDASLKYKELPDILEQMSGAGVHNFLKIIFDDKQVKSLMHPYVERDIYESVRRLQDFAYAQRGFPDEYWDKKKAAQKKRVVKEEMWQELNWDVARNA